MPTKKIISSKDELADLILSDNNILSMIETQEASVPSQSASTSKERFKTRRLTKYSNELKSMILDKLAGTPGAALGRIFEMRQFEKIDKNTVRINFSRNTYRKNLFNTHISFVPILLNYGWEVSKEIGVNYHNYTSESDGSAMTFQYYAGCHFISDAIKEFNEKHKKDGVWANFMYGTEDITLYDGSGKLPYIKKYLK